MKKRIRATVMISVASLGVIAAVLFPVLFEIERKCNVSFDFVDSKEILHLPSERPNEPDAALGCYITKAAAEENLRTIAVNRAGDFKRWLSWQRSDREWKRFIQSNPDASCLREMEDEELARLVSSAEFTITRMPMTNFVFGCEIRLPDLPGCNMNDIARAFMAVLADFVSDLNEVNVYKASFMEQQEKARRERKIAQLEKAGDGTTIELAREREAIKELDAKIAAIRKQVFETYEKRITNVVISTTASIKWRQRTQ